ncbi:MAG: hypothetical protein KatS3mg105_5010 [Gemmatales bacterium]|nr:MAG: hypothetical protein KatS3mg105_5010 [Gemmatales bacterium]
MEIELWDIGRVKPYENNPRKNDDSVDAVAASIREFGFRQPIVVDAEGVIIVGHTRYKAALKLGLERVPVHVARDLSSEQLRAYRILDNRSAEFSSWNYELLPLELESLASDGVDLPSLYLSDDVEWRPRESKRRSVEKRAMKKEVLGSGFRYGVLIECASESDQLSLLDRFSVEFGSRCRSVIW